MNKKAKPSNEIAISLARKTNWNKTNREGERREKEKRGGHRRERARARLVG